VTPGGRRAAAIYTLIETCKLNEIDPPPGSATFLLASPDHPAQRVGGDAALELEGNQATGQNQSSLSSAARPLGPHRMLTKDQQPPALADQGRRRSAGKPAPHQPEGETRAATSSTTPASLKVNGTIRNLDAREAGMTTSAPSSPTMELRKQFIPRALST